MAKARRMPNGRASQGMHQNRLLASLPREEYERLRPHLIPARLKYRCVLYEANEPIEFVHFIETGVGSLVNTMINGDAAEVMQVAGASLKMKAEVLREEMHRNDALQEAMLHYAHAFFNQVAQSAACNIFHHLEQRCCRWLLMTADRM